MAVRVSKNVFCKYLDNKISHALICRRARGRPRPRVRESATSFSCWKGWGTKYVHFAPTKLRQLPLISLPRQPPGSSEEISAIHGFFIGFLWPVRENRNHETHQQQPHRGDGGREGPHDSRDDDNANRWGAMPRDQPHHARAEKKSG